MKQFVFYILSSFFLISCGVFQPKVFTEKALEEKLVTIERDSITFKEILNKNKDKEIFAQIFATYCPVSQDSFEDVIAFQKENNNKEYVFLSVDHSYHDWKNGLKRMKVKGQFYYIPKKGKGALGKFLKLKSIPRFLKIDKNGVISVFKTSKVTDKLK